jgi:hypothetical protein
MDSFASKQRKKLTKLFMNLERRILLVYPFSLLWHTEKTPETDNINEILVTITAITATPTIIAPIIEVITNKQTDLNNGKQLVAVAVVEETIDATTIVVAVTEIAVTEIAVSADKDRIDKKDNRGTGKTIR